MRSMRLSVCSINSEFSSSRNVINDLICFPMLQFLSLLSC
jgi:hypothetical protein